MDGFTNHFSLKTHGYNFFNLHLQKFPFENENRNDEYHIYKSWYEVLEWLKGFLTALIVMIFLMLVVVWKI